MDPSKAIVVKTFVRPVDADIAAAQLRGRGIEYLITSDDCGGMYPSLELIKMMVAPEDAEAARAILGQTPAAAESDVTVSVEEPLSSVAGAPPPRVYRFNSGLLVGVIVGVLLHVAFTKYDTYRSVTTYYD